MNDQEYLSSLIAFLSKPAVYPEKTETVEIIQTHASVVAVCDNYVYKFKKGVNFGFLDFSSLEKRKFYCAEELRLNRRLAKEIYIDIIPLYLSKSGYSFTGTSGQTTEFAVKMHRMKEPFFLVNLIKESHFDIQKIAVLADKLADYYRQYPVSEAGQAWGERDKIQLSIEENFNQIQAFVGHSLSSLAFEMLRKYQFDFLDRNDLCFEQRLKAGKIKDCHGDLRAEHIYFLEEGVDIYDCIEFNERFKCIDQVNDLAFLSMDLTYRKRYDLAAYFLEKILPQIEEEASISALLDFYQVYRACVRGKVNAMKAQETEIGLEGQKESRIKAQNYFGLALRYALLGSTKTLLITLGGVASGKSTLAAACAKYLFIPHLNSDVIRKQKAGINPLHRGSEAERKSLYSDEMTTTTYQTLLSEGLEAINKNGAVILDATFRDTKWLYELKKESEQQGLRMVIVKAQAPAQIIKARLAEREKKQNVSDVHLEDYQEDQFGFKADLSDFEEVILADTTLSEEETLKHIFERLQIQNAF